MDRCLFLKLFFIREFCLLFNAVNKKGTQVREGEKKRQFINNKILKYKFIFITSWTDAAIYF